MISEDDDEKFFLYVSAYLYGHGINRPADQLYKTAGEN